MQIKIDTSVIWKNSWKHSLPELLLELSSEFDYRYSLSHVIVNVIEGIDDAFANRYQHDEKSRWIGRRGEQCVTRSAAPRPSHALSGNLKSNMQ